VIPAFAAFLSIGGRAMINPNGELEFGGGMNWTRPEMPEAEANRQFQVERTLALAIEQPSNVEAIEAAVRERGRPLSGWIVLRGGEA